MRPSSLNFYSRILVLAFLQDDLVWSDLRFDNCRFWLHIPGFRKSIYIYLTAKLFVHIKWGLHHSKVCDITPQSQFRKNKPPQGSLVACWDTTGHCSDRHYQPAVKVPKMGGSKWVPPESVFGIKRPPKLKWGRMIEKPEDKCELKHPDMMMGSWW